MADETTCIRDVIYEIRGQKVMLDRDLAGLYGVEVKRLNEAVKRNIERFPPYFMFELTKEESNKQIYVGSVIPPDYNFGVAMSFAFTEKKG